MKKSWNLKQNADISTTQHLSNSLNVDAIVAQLLCVRDIKTFEEARQFFRPTLDGLHDPFLMTDMHGAVNRLTEAIHQKQHILIYGDYDVDGTTAVTMVYSFLTEIGVQCFYYIPDRYTEGYGFSFKGVDFAKEKNCALIITLDCGVRDGEKIDYAASLGIDVIVCDHHQPAEIPKAVAVLDPKRPDCAYPFKGLSGAGVGFKLLQALCAQQTIDENLLYCYLDLVTISIGADIVPMTGENRILAFLGLQKLRDSPRTGIAAMLHHANFQKPALTITDVVFILAPRINAAGRIFSGTKAVELLLSDSEEEALLLSTAIEEYNSTRKGLDKEITAQAIEKIKSDPFYLESMSTIVFEEGWHKGVVGIVASRLIEVYYKPTIVLVSDGENMAGSARSIDGIDLFECLFECADLLTQFGGHAMAAGLSLPASQFANFRTRFDAVIKHKLQSKCPIPSIAYDAEINFTDISPKLHRIIKQFEPFGPENLSPIFLTRNVQNKKFTRTVGENDKHLKLHVCQKITPHVVFEGIGFDLGSWAPMLLSNGVVDLLYSIEENHWNNHTTLQLVVKDIRESKS